MAYFSDYLAFQLSIRPVYCLWSHSALDDGRCRPSVIEDRLLYTAVYEPVRSLC